MDGRIHLSPEQEVVLGWQLAEQVIRDGFRPDLVLSLYRGGCRVGPTIVEAMRGIMGWDFDDFPIKARKYDEQNHGGENVAIWGVSALPTPPPGRNVLLVDDIYDTGHTNRVAIGEIRRQFHPLTLDLRVATSAHKSGNDLNGAVPTYFVQEYPGNPWLVQAYEKESVWGKALRDRLKADGFPVKEYE